MSISISAATVAPRLLFGCALLASAVAMPAASQTLPPARELIDGHIAAVGGRDAVTAHSSMHLTGSFTMPAMGMTGRYEIWQKRPDRLASTVDVPGIGQVRRGFDGEVGWTVSPIEGPRVIKDAELAQLADEANLRSALRDTSLVASAQTVERTEMGGTACFLVRIEWKSGRETFDCYAVDSGLLVASRMTAQTQMGPLESTMIFSDYQQFGRYRMPAQSRQQVMGMEQVIRIENVRFDTVSDSVFALPPEIKALLGG